jgi:hypothetical protein
MQSDFTKCLESITKQSQETDRATKKLIKDTETKQASANQQLLDAFEASQKQTDDAIKLVSELRVTLTEQDTCDKAFQKMFLSMYTAMAAENKVSQVSDNVLKVTEHIHGNRSQQTKRTAKGNCCHVKLDVTCGLNCEVTHRRASPVTNSTHPAPSINHINSNTTPKPIFTHPTTASTPKIHLNHVQQHQCHSN